VSKYEIAPDRQLEMEPIKGLDLKKVGAPKNPGSPLKNLKIIESTKLVELHFSGKNLKIDRSSRYINGTTTSRYNFNGGLYHLLYNVNNFFTGLLLQL